MTASLAMFSGAAATRAAKARVMATKSFISAEVEGVGVQVV
jgi:hypothetical protein